VWPLRRVGVVVEVVVALDCGHVSIVEVSLEQGEFPLYDYCTVPYESLSGFRAAQKNTLNFLMTPLTMIVSFRCVISNARREAHAAMQPSSV